ncbi:MAG: DUF4249 domain-containing protein [Janthinobacterium lividum]
MTRIFWLRWAAWGGVGLLSGCVEPYLPNVPAATQDYLVVNGFINSRGITTIQLTRSLQLSDTKAPTPETRASVFIQANGGQRFALTESPAGSGTYTSASLTLNPGLTYQLRITTAGRDYASDLEPAKLTPPIDGVRWQYEREGVQVYVSAHDDTQANTYYRWRYEQTWQSTSTYEAFFEYNPTLRQITRRTQDTYHCWRTSNPSTVIQTSTARLSQNVVKDFPLVFMPIEAEQLRFKYSILVQQYAQSRAEYDYWEALKKNTESLGSINDPLPTQLTGNVHCLSNSDEPVLGFVGVHSVSQQRIFISRLDVPQLRNIISQTGNDEATCFSIIDGFALGSYYDGPFSYTSIYLVYNYNLNANGQPQGWLGAPARCVDCRLNGTNVKPSFWPQ